MLSISNYLFYTMLYVKQLYLDMWMFLFPWCCTQIHLYRHFFLSQATLVLNVYYCIGNCLQVLQFKMSFKLIFSIRSAEMLYDQSMRYILKHFSCQIQETHHAWVKLHQNLLLIFLVISSLGQLSTNLLKWYLHCYSSAIPLYDTPVMHKHACS